MSFSFDFVARTKQDALDLLEKNYAPYAVKQIVESAIRGLRDADAIKVIATGHLCQSDTDWQYSSVHVSVEPIVCTKVQSDFCGGAIPNTAAGVGTAGGASSVAVGPLAFNGVGK